VGKEFRVTPSGVIGQQFITPEGVTLNIIIYSLEEN
jgi:hypothetical protein